MATRSRVKDGILGMHFSFGRAKHGMEFKDQLEFEDYIDPLLGNSVSYSLDAVPSSPFIRKVGAVRREETWNKPQRIMQIIANHYRSTSSKLHYGFLKEHADSFFRIISANLQIHKEESVFLPLLNETGDDVLDDDVLDEHLLQIYYNSHQNDLPGNYLPETDKYKPLNESMMAVPPNLRDWRAKQENQNHSYSFNSPTFQPHSSAQHITPRQSDSSTNQLIGITFRTFDTDDNETSVLICDKLTSASTMEEVMLEGEVLDDLDLDDDPDTYKYIIKKESKGRLTLKWRRFKNLAVSSFVNIQNVDKNYLIALKK